MTHDIFNVNSPAWMDNEGRNCAIPEEFTADETRMKADMWFPTESHEAKYAKRLCLNCPVAHQCFMYAYERPELEGIWGGTTTGQRDNLRSKRGWKRAA